MTESTATLPKHFSPIFSDGRSMFGLRLLSLLGMGIWYISMDFSWDIFNSLGLNPVDGYDGQLAPLSHRIGLSSFVAVTASSVFVIVVFMSQQVVTKILLSEDEETLRIKTAGFWNWGGIDIPVKHLLLATEEDHEGESGVSVRRLRIRVKERKWSLWIQLPGKVLDDAAFRKHVLRKKRGR